MTSVPEEHFAVFEEDDGFEEFEIEGKNTFDYYIIPFDFIF